MKTVLRNAAPATDAGYRAQDAWTAFWADLTQSHCVAGAPTIGRALAAHWSSLAGSLAANSSVLDLGCGAGVVGGWMLRARPDLRVTGIDSARIQRRLHPQLELLAETAMEDLPFDDQRFGAVVSQFGFEYSRRGPAAREIARTLKPRGVMSLLVHHAGSAVLATSRERKAVLDSLLAPPMRAAFCGGDAASLNSLLSTLCEIHPGDELLIELARSLPPRLGRSPENRQAIWAAIEEALAPELCVVRVLVECCVSEAGLDDWLEPLRVVGELMAVSILREPNGNPIAWKIEASRGAGRD